ncbi:pentapeptide repeat-containing protein [Geodermatophilus siccatus]|uniref:pentapeptide repeat-containing protein n=1 Tax=Geodermatophilus siccatus TaxID=1137991 RepID=UPI000B890B63|nr:pentapeptide repeat-containing protein [Geodermatophilus siccatus]
MGASWWWGGLAIVLGAAGALLALVPGRAEKQDPSDLTRPDREPVPWHKRVRQRLQQRRLPVLIYLGVVAVAALVVVVWVLPSVLTRHPQLDNPAERHKAVTDTRTGLVAMLAAIGAAGGLAYTARTYRLGQENHRLSQETYRLSREGHITDRFSKAVKQLGNEKIEVRLGGIYALERLMHDNPADQPTIMETLAAFVRQHAPHSSRPVLLARGTPPPAPYHPAEDVQAVLTVLGRRHPVDGERPIDLSRTNLTGANLLGANLIGADLFGATLTGANLYEATLTSANLYEATLTDRSLTDKQLATAENTDEISWVPPSWQSG